MDDEMFAELEASLAEGMDILHGKKQPSRTITYDVPDVKAIREALKLTQHQFATLIGISVRTLQNWEQGHRVPEGPARVLLMVVARNPQAVLDAVHTSHPRSSNSGNARIYNRPLAKVKKDEKIGGCDTRISNS